MAVPDPHFTEFVRSGSEEAFARLARRHMDMVYATARRVLGSREDAAADVAQTVFCQLARQARRLPQDLTVSVWLHARTRQTALNVLRGEARRAARERTAADLMQLNASDPDDVNAALPPHIDTALAELPKVDQRALALRFFEQCPFQEIGDRLGLSADAARKRLERALETLRTRLAGRGVTLSAAALALWLSEEAVKAAPPSLTASGLAAGALHPTAQSAAAGTAAAFPLPFSLSFVMTGIKSMIIGAALGLAGGGFWAARTDQDTAPSPRPQGPALTPGASGRSGDLGAAARQRFAVPAAARTVEGLVDQLHSLISAPDNALTRQRLAVWLAEVPPDLFKPLMISAHARLSSSESGRWLPDLAAAWGKRDRADAVLSLSGMFADIPHFGSHLAATAFQAWHESSPAQALNWMMEHQEDPRLAHAMAPIISAVAEGLAATSSDDAVRWASRLQGNDFQEAALRPVWEKLKAENDPGAWAEVCGKLMREEDGGFRRLALGQAIGEWCARGAAGSVGCAAANAWLASLPPSLERSAAAELLLGHVLNARDYPLKDPSPALVEALREADPRNAAEAVREAVRAEPGALSVNALKSLLPLIPAAEREEVIVRAARQLAFGNKDRVLWPDRAVQWAAELPDAAVRDPLVYAITRQWLRQHDAGDIPWDPGQWPDAAHLSPAVQQRMRDARRDFESEKNP